MTNTILQIIKIDSKLIDQIKPSFDKLPETDHKDGNFRLRKYSRVNCYYAEWCIEIEKQSDNSFTQSSKYNKHQGGMNRVFEPIDDDVISSEVMGVLMQSFYSACNFNPQFEVDIHQMRIRCTGGATQLSPEGWHQDGYDCVGMIGINRCNIIGGHVLLSTSKTEEPFLQAIMDSGTMVIVDDSHLWHNGRSIQPIDDDKPAYMDVMVFTAKK